MRAFVVSLLLAGSIAAAEKPNESKTNPQIAEVVKEISAKNIEAIDRKLVSFGTRHTLSDATSETRGIGAARRWIQSEFERYSKESGGRLQVTMDEFTQPPAPPRVLQPAQLVNVVATLPGTQAESSDRIYVVSGHY
ncbi:MAG: aminopeptidase, partial [Chthoniobacterales bacterium]